MSADMHAVPDHYRCFGLRISSELPLPELPLWPQDDLPLEAAIQPDVVVRFGAVPAQWPQTSAARLAPGADFVSSVDTRTAPTRFQSPYLSIATDGRALFRLDDVGRFLIAHGSQITIEPATTPASPDLRLFLLGTVLGLLCYQRGMLPLHAAAVVIDQQVVALAGNSGAGKSTLAAAFWRRGYRLLSDDLAMLAMDSGNTADAQPLRVLPGVPRLRMWSDALTAMNWSSEGLEPCRHRQSKFARPLEHGFQDSALPLAAIVHLRPPFLNGGTPAPAFARLRGLPAMQAMSTQLYRRRAGLALLGDPGALITLSRAAGAVPQHLQLFRPLSFDALDATVDAIVSTVSRTAPPAASPDTPAPLHANLDA